MKGYQGILDLAIVQHSHEHKQGRGDGDQIESTTRSDHRHLLLGRLLPLSEALLFLNLGGVMGCAFSHRAVPFLGSPQGDLVA
jgi:hypothetical protein